MKLRHAFVENRCASCGHLGFVDDHRHLCMICLGLRTEIDCRRLHEIERLRRKFARQDSHDTFAQHPHAEAAPRIVGVPRMRKKNRRRSHGRMAQRWIMAVVACVEIFALLRSDDSSLQ
jgi:hypothetical protein